MTTNDTPALTILDAQAAEAVIASLDDAAASMRDALADWEGTEGFVLEHLGSNRTDLRLDRTGGAEDLLERLRDTVADVEEIAERVTLDKDLERRLRDLRDAIEAAWPEDAPEGPF